MNMISTGSFLTEMDASNKQETLAEKFAAVWEKKNSKAARAGGVSLMALSLAACGSSSDDTPAVVTPPVVTPPVVTPPAAQSFVLTTSNDIMQGGEGADTFAATDTTYTTNDVIIGNAGADTLTITAAAGASVTAAASVSGVETVNVIVNSFDTETVDMANVISANINVSNSQVSGATSITVNNLNVTSTLNVDAAFTGTATVTGSGTVNATDASTVSATLGSVGGTITIVADDDTNTINLVAAAAAAGNVADAAVLSGVGTIALDNEGAGNTVVEVLTLSGNGAAVTFDLADATTVANTVEKLTITGSQDVTLVVGADAIEAIATYADTSTAGTTTVKLDAAGAAGGVDLRKLTAQVIEIGYDTNANTLTVADGQVLKFTTAVTTADVTLDINDGATTNKTDGVVTVDLDVAATTGVGFALDTANDKIATLNLVNDKVAQTDLEVLAGAAGTIVLTGDKAVTLEATSTALALNATNFKAAVTHTLDGTSDIATLNLGSGDDVITNATAASSATITGGAGKDTLNIDITASAVNFDGGAGVDTVTATGTIDMSAATLSNIEVISIDGVGLVSFDASQISGQSWIIKADAGNDYVIVGGTGGTGSGAIKAIDQTSLDLSKLVIDSGTVEGINVRLADYADAFGAATAMTVIGSSIADTIVGNGGIDNITGGAGIDTITAGAGNDIINLAETTDVADKVVFGSHTANGKDTISGFQANDTFNVAALGDGGIAQAATAVTAAGAQRTLVDNDSVVITTNGAAADITTSGTKTISDFTNATQVAEYLAEAFLTAVGANSEAHVFVINDEGSDNTYIWSFDSADNNQVIASTEITLVAVIANGGVDLADANIVYA